MHEARFRAMGTDCHICVVGPDETQFAEREVRRLEGLWTRFAASELSSVGIDPVTVDPDTRLLLQRAVAGYDLTAGLFNPFLVEQIQAAGYDRDFESLQPGPRPHAQPGRRAAVVIDGETVSSDLAVDSGGIGKGLAADLICQRLMERGATGALVNIGGDVRCQGSAPDGPWQVGISTPLDDVPEISVRIDDGGLCTSTPRLRAWKSSDGHPMNHLLDPRTGLPVTTDLASVSVIAREAWLAEVLSKAILLAAAGQAEKLLGTHDAAAVIVTDDGQIRQL